MANELYQRPVTELAPLLRARKLSPVELLQAYLRRIAEWDEKVRAFLLVSEDRAMEEAKRAEQEISRGRYRGPLHGVPFAVKDLIASKGIRTTNGSRVHENWVPDYDATVLRKLEEAGAILLGKLNLLEFAMGSGQVGLRGAARNPWDLAYSPSGSSSGSGAALAAGMTPLAIGTDTGGSIRGPAKSCGVVGLKPTYGRVSRYGVTALSWTLDHVGPMARTVGDAATLLQVIAGADPRDASSASTPVPNYAKAMAGSVKGLRLGIPSGYFWEKVHTETEAALREAIAVLRSLGVRLVEVEVRQAPMASAASAVILSAESAAVHEGHLREKAELLDSLVRERLEAGTFHSALDYIKALRVRTLLLEEMDRVFRECDVLVLPAGNAAPRLEEEIVGSDAPVEAPRAPRPDTWNLANVTGNPALVLPCGFTKGPPVLPLGIQFCGRHFEEGTLFRVGHAYQSVTEWHRRSAAGIAGG